MTPHPKHPLAYAQLLSVMSSALEDGKPWFSPGEKVL